MKLSDCNQSLLLKWPWRFGREDGALWRKVLCSKYGWGESSLWPEVVSGRQLSKVWSDIQNSWTDGPFANVVRDGSFYVVGIGNRVDFWSDVWIEGGPLKGRFPRIFALAVKQDGVVSDFIHWDGLVPRWQVDLRRRLFDWELSVWEEFNGVLRAAGVSRLVSDRRVWKRSPDGLFSAKSCRESRFLQGREESGFFKLIWRGVAPPKVEIFVWRALEEGIPVLDTLHRRGVCVEKPNLCPFCISHVEAGDHLLLSCDFSWSIWCACVGMWGIRLAFPSSLRALLLEWKYILCDRTKSAVWETLFFGVVWTLWLSRNEIIFENKRMDSERIVDVIKWRVLAWIRAKYPSLISSTSQEFREIQEVSVLPRNKLVRPVGSWLPPLPGWWKMNFDGSSLGNPGDSGIGGVVRDEKGVIILMFYAYIGFQDSSYAEYAAAEFGIRLITSSCLGPWPPILVEGDSSNVIGWLQEVELVPWRLFKLKNSIMANSCCLGRYAFKHTLRESNGFADALAKRASVLKRSWVAWM